LDGVVDPIADAYTYGEEELEAGTESAADFFGGHLGGEHGDENGGAADAEPGDDASGVEGADGVGVDDLEDGADAEDKGADDETEAPAQPSGDGPDGEAAEKGAGLQDGDAIGVYLGLVLVGVAKVALEGFQSKDSAYLEGLCQNSSNGNRTGVNPPRLYPRWGVSAFSAR